MRRRPSRIRKGSPKHFLILLKLVSLLSFVTISEVVLGFNRHYDNPRIFPYTYEKHKTLPSIDILRAQATETDGQKEFFDNSIRNVVEVLMTHFFNRTGLDITWERDYVLKADNSPGTVKVELSSEPLPRLKYNTTTSSVFRRIINETGNAKFSDSNRDSVLTWGPNEQEHTNQKTIPNTVDHQAQHKAIQAPVDFRTTNGKDPVKKDKESLSSTNATESLTDIIVNTDTVTGRMETDGKSYKVGNSYFYPENYLNACVLGIGYQTLPVLWRIIDMLPQLSFWIFEKALHTETGEQLLMQFPKRKLYFIDDSEIQRLHPSCDLVFFSVDSVEFSMAKVQSMFKKTSEMLLIFLTTGCTPGFANLAELQQEPMNTFSRQCRFLTQLWGSTLCNRPEDTAVTYSQMQEMKSTKYGSVGKCYSGGRKILKVLDHDLVGDYSETVLDPDILIDDNDMLKTLLGETVLESLTISSSSDDPGKSGSAANAVIIGQDTSFALSSKYHDAYNINRIKEKILSELGSDGRIIQTHGMIMLDKPRIMESGTCMCLLDSLWLSDLFYENPKCDQFVHQKLPPGKRIHARHTENWYDPSKDWFFGYGQWNQDWFVYQNFFQNKKDGIFLDIGAMSPFELSNTAVFEQCFGWKGICVEPNPSQHTLFLSYRSCRLVPFCVGSNTGSLKMFAVPDGSTGHGKQVLSDVENATTAKDFSDNQKFLQDWLTKSSDAVDAFQSKCVSMDDMLLVSGYPLGSTIDLVSIDIEGGEFEVLRDFPFEFWKVNVLIVEAGAKNVHRIDTIMFTNNYRKVGLLGKDHIYAHNDFLMELAFNHTVGHTQADPHNLIYPPYINIEPYKDTFRDFQRRFIDPDFGH